MRDNPKIPTVATVREGGGGAGAVVSGGGEFSYFNTANYLLGRASLAPRISLTPRMPS